MNNPGGGQWGGAFYGHTSLYNTKDLVSWRHTRCLYETHVYEEFRDARLLSLFFSTLFPTHQLPSSSSPKHKNIIQNGYINITTPLRVNGIITIWPRPRLIDLSKSIVSYGSQGPTYLRSCREKSKSAAALESTLTFCGYIEKLRHLNFGIQLGDEFTDRMYL